MLPIRICLWSNGDLSFVRVTVSKKNLVAVSSLSSLSTGQRVLFDPKRSYLEHTVAGRRNFARLSEAVPYDTRLVGSASKSKYRKGSGGKQVKR